MNNKGHHQNPYLVTIIKTVLMINNVVWLTNVMMPSIAYSVKKQKVINVISSMNVQQVVVIMANATFEVIALLDVKLTMIVMNPNVALIRYVLIT